MLYTALRFGKTRDGSWTNDDLVAELYDGNLHPGCQHSTTQPATFKRCLMGLMYMIWGWFSLRNRELWDTIEQLFSHSLFSPFLKLGQTGICKDWRGYILISEVSTYELDMKFSITVALVKPQMWLRLLPATKLGLAEKSVAKLILADILIIRLGKQNRPFNLSQSLLSISLDCAKMT